MDAESFKLMAALDRSIRNLPQILKTNVTVSTMRNVTPDIFTSYHAAQNILAMLQQLCNAAAILLKSYIVLHNQVMNTVRTSLQISYAWVAIMPQYST